MGIDILGVDIVGVDILGIDIPAPTHFYSHINGSILHRCVNVMVPINISE